MKTIVRSLQLSLLLSCIAGSASAQIRDDESSQAVLAVQCAVSSGYSASEYEDYSRRLAKTLSLLTSSQQKKVFGYLPQPAAISLSEADTTPTSVSPDRGAIKEADPGLLVGFVGDLNNALGGVASASSAVYGGEPVSVGSTVSGLVKGNTAGNIQDAASAIASSSKKGNSWDAIVSWLSALAERARLR